MLLAPSAAVLRIAELRRLYRSRSGHELPHDDAGKADARIMAHHLGKRPNAVRNISLWCGLWTPWMSEPEIAALTSEVLATPRRWRADTLGNRLGLREAERRRLRIVTIGSIEVTKAERLKRRRERGRGRDEARRRSKGAKPRREYEANSISRAKPWERLGISDLVSARQAKWVTQVRAQYTSCLI
jgi:hypothetical protein